jgi:hypothetical protein
MIAQYRQIRGIARKRKLNLKLELVFLFDRRTTVITCSIPLVSRLRLAATVSGPVSGQEKAAHPGLYYRGAGGWVIRGCYGRPGSAVATSYP